MLKNSISVIVPIYNTSAYIGRCIDSILKQTFDNFDIILVDDGSTDNSGKICDEYKLKDNRITVIHQNNQGLSAARNAGIDYVFANSDSEWLTFIDSDDWIHPQYLELLYGSALESGANISVCSYRYVDSYFISNTKYSLNYSLNRPEYLYLKETANATVAWGKLYKRSLFENIRYPLNRFHEDEFITYKILFCSDELCFINKQLYYYFNNINGITKSEYNPKKALDATDAFIEQIEFFQKTKHRDIYLYKIEILLNYLYDQINILKSYNAVDKFYKKQFENRYVEILFKYRKEMPILKNIKKYTNILHFYSIFNPIFVFTRFVRNQISK